MSEWKLVPVEPTEEIRDAVCRAKNLTQRGPYALMTNAELDGIYRAAIAAAPPAPSAEPVAWVDERAVAWLESHPRGKITTQLEGRKTFERPMPLYAAPPPAPSAEPVGFLTQSALGWAQRQTEKVVKLARHSQPEHGFTEPLYTTPPAHTEAPADWDSIALQAAQEIALMWGQDRSEFVSKIQVRVLDAMLAVLDPPAPSAEPHELRVALHRISLASQNSMSSKEECGRIARNALHGLTPPAPSAEPAVEQYIALCDAMGYNERADVLASPEDHAAALVAAARPAPSAEPVAWVLTKELDCRETTCRAHLWFSDPQNSAWTAIYTTPPDHREVMVMAFDALEHVVRHFTRAPSSLSDSEARGEAHKALDALAAALEGKRC